MYFASGTSIARFPENGLVIKRSLNNQGIEVLKGQAEKVDGVAILGLYQAKPIETAGRVAIYGDSNCLDTAHMQKECFWLLEALLQYATTDHMPPIFKDLKSENILSFKELPQRMDGNHLYRYSKVLENRMGTGQTRPLPVCVKLKWATPYPLNKSAPSSLYKAQKLLSVGLDMPLPFKPGGLVDPMLVKFPWDTSQTVSTHSTDRFHVLNLLALVGMIAIGLLLLFQWLHLRWRPRRRKRLRRAVQTSARVPVV